MNIIETGLRAALLCLSLLGLTGYFRVRLRIPAHASYLFTLSLVACTVYFAGLLGVLGFSVLFVLGVGYVCLFALLLGRRVRAAFAPRGRALQGALFLLTFGMVCAFLAGYRFLSYDNYAHWGIVVKHLLTAGTFPDAGSALVAYKAYPLGVSSYLYFVSSVVGRSAGVLLLGQASLIFAAVYAMLGVIRDAKRILLSALVGFGCAMMTFFNLDARLNDLLVDFLMPLLALGALATGMGNPRRHAMACGACAPMLGLLLITRMDGFAYAVPVLCYLLAAGLSAARGQGAGAKLGALGAWLGCLALAAAPLIAWLAHTAAVFPGDSSKFALTAQYLSDATLTKTPAQVRQIFQAVMSAAVSKDQLSVQGFAVVNVLALVAWANARFGFGLRWRLGRATLLLDTFAVLYHVGLAAFYALFLPLSESLRLVSFSRYAGGALVFVIGGLILFAARDVEDSFYIQQGEERSVSAFRSLRSKRIYQAATMACCAGVVLFLMTDLSAMAASEATYPTSLPGQLETLLGDRWTDADTHSYLIYGSDENQQVSNYSVQYAGRYLLCAPHVDATSAMDAALGPSTLLSYDYFVIYQSDDAIQTYMQEQFRLPGNVGVYPIQELAERLTKQ